MLWKHSSGGGRQPPGEASSRPSTLFLSLAQHLAHSDCSVNIYYAIERAGTNLGLLGAMDLPLLVLPRQLSPKGTLSGRQWVLSQPERGQSASFAVVSPLVVNILFSDGRLGLLAIICRLLHKKNKQGNALGPDSGAGCHSVLIWLLEDWRLGELGCAPCLAVAFQNNSKGSC